MDNHERDLQHIEGVQAGDDSLRFVIAMNYTNLIFKFANLFGRDHPEVDSNDLVQDAIVYVAKSIHKFDKTKGTKPITYLSELAIGNIRSHLRGHRRRTKRQVSLFKIVGKDDKFLLDVLKVDDDPAKMSLELETVAYLHSYLVRLLPVEQQVISDVLAGKSLKEMGMKPAKAKEIFERAKRKLRKLMDPERTLN